MAKEVELRAPISADGHATLLALLQSSSPKLQARCFIDYSTFLEGIGERKLDVRVRVTNGTPEIIVKKGTFGAAVREEAALPFEPGNLDDALSVMALLGFKKGVAGGRRIWRGRLDEVEVALQEVLDFAAPDRVGDRFVEVEYVGAPRNEADAISILKRFLSNQGIEPFEIEQWNDYIATLNKTLNGVYEHGQTPTETI